MKLRYAAIVLIVLGVLLQLAFYLQNRSLNIDEAALALKIKHFSYPELINPQNRMDQHAAVRMQAAPLGFLIVEKCLVRLWGDHEFVFRLFPLFCGIASLILFSQLACKYLSPVPYLVALTIFAFAPGLIYFSSEVKPYSTDVLISIILLLIAECFSVSKFNKRQIMAAIFAAGCVWFSFTAVFVLAAIALSITLTAIFERDWKKIPPVLLIMGIWAVSFIINYFTFLKHFAAAPVFKGYWVNEFLLLPSLDLLGISRFITVLFARLGHLLYIPSTAAAIVLIVGTFSLYKEKRRRLGLLCMIMGLAIFASQLGRYPFAGRLILFLTPVLIILASASLEALTRRGNKIALLAILAVAAVFSGAWKTTASLILTPNTHESGIRPVLSKLQELKQPQDKLYIYYGGSNVFQYYKSRFGFKDEESILGISSRGYAEGYYADLQKLKGNERVWLLFFHVYDREDKIMISYVEQMGQLRDWLWFNDANAYLYEMR